MKIQRQPQEVFYKKGALKNFAIFTGKTLFWSLFFIKLQAFNFTKKRLQNRSFPMNTAKFLKTTYVSSKKTSSGCFQKS